MSYEYNFYIKSDLDALGKFLMNYFTTELNNKSFDPLSIDNGEIFSLSTENYSLNVQKAFWRTVQYMKEDYNVNVTVSLSFHPYENRGVNGINMMLQFIVSLLGSIDGDCVFMPNGDYIGILRREGEVYIDTSKSCFNGVNISLLDIPYTETTFDM